MNSVVVYGEKGDRRRQHDGRKRTKGVGDYDERAAPCRKGKKGGIAAESPLEEGRWEDGRGRRVRPERETELNRRRYGRTLRSRGMKESRVAAAEGLVMLADETRGMVGWYVWEGGMTRWRVGGRQG